MHLRMYQVDASDKEVNNSNTLARFWGFLAFTYNDQCIYAKYILTDKQSCNRQFRRRLAEDEALAEEIQTLQSELIEIRKARPPFSFLVEAIRVGGAQAVGEYLTPPLAESDINLLLLVDQFEEIFRFGLHTDRAERRDEAADFVSIMLALSEQRELPVYVVMTMRSDFIGECDHFYGLPEALNRSLYLVPHL
jgi:hypothetical protein